jgi:hypothetical protein
MGTPSETLDWLEISAGDGAIVRKIPTEGKTDFGGGTF